MPHPPILEGLAATGANRRERPGVPDVSSQAASSRAAQEVPGTGRGTGAGWRRVRTVLTERRPSLARAAAGLYPQLPRVAGTELLTRPEWLPATPLDLDQVPLHWVSEAPAPVVDGAGEVTAHVRPHARDGAMYPTYSAAIADLDRPSLFENRVCYRLLAATLPGPPAPAATRNGPPGLSLSRCRYFEAVDVGHAVAHEFAAAWLASPERISLAGLPLRASAGDPCDLPRRPAIVAATTLTLRRGTGRNVSFILHWRDPAKVNHAGGMYQVMPVGVFQPLADTPVSVRADLSLFANIVREFSEEFLGTSEYYAGAGDGFRYGQWPFYRRLAQARQAGKLVVHCAGVGVDPLTFASDILTVAVFDGDLFDEVFAGLTSVNAEGRVFAERGSAWIPFTGENVARFTGGQEPMQPAGAAVLRLAWQHRRQLLG